MAAVPNYARFPGPGDFSPAEDDFSDARWQDAVCVHAEKLQAHDSVSEIVEQLADDNVALAIQNALTGRPLSFGQRRALERMQSLCRNTHAAVSAVYGVSL